MRRAVRDVGDLRRIRRACDLGYGGFPFFRRRNELLRALPVERPHYDDAHLTPYEEMGAVGQDEDEDPFHFGRSLLDQIRSTPEQEIGTHTFSHYYCLEPTQSIAVFQADLRAALAAAAVQAWS